MAQQLEIADKILAGQRNMAYYGRERAACTAHCASEKRESESR
jgi:hypothetical protein